MKQETYDSIIRQLKIDEGYRQCPYVCPAGYMTIGYGTMIEDMSEEELHYLGAGSWEEIDNITKEDGEWLLSHRFNKILLELKEKLSWFETMPESVKEALANMAYNMGVPTLLHFKNMLGACKEHRWIDAGNEAQASRWYEQVGHRGPRVVAKLMEPAF